MVLDLTSSDWTLSELLEENDDLRLQVDVLAARVRQLWPRARALDEVVDRVRRGSATLAEVAKVIEHEVGWFGEPVT